MFEKLLRERKAYFERQCLDFLGAQNYEHAVEIVAYLETLGLRPSVKEKNNRFEMEEKDGRFVGKFLSDVTFHLISIETGAEVLEMCGAAGCTSDMSELKCPNIKTLCVDHCGEKH